MMKLAIAGSALCLALLGGCAAKHVSPADRDTTGAYDGVWIGTVGGPRASRETLPGNWYMTCDWEPYDIYLTVDDGRVQLGKLEGKTPVSKKGSFRIDVSSGPASMTMGVMSGNSDFMQVFSGNLAGSNPRGKYAQFVSSIGRNGCSGPIRFRRYSGSAA